MGNKIQRIYVGSNLVRPTEITETFTVSKSSTIDIAKSGFKIKQIKTSYTSSASATNQYMSASVTITDETGTYSMGIPYAYLSYNITSNNKLLNLYCKYNGNQTNEYSTPKLTPVNGPFVFEFTTTKDSVHCICNNNTILDQTATTKWNQTAEYMFSLPKLNLQYYLGGTTSYYTGSDNATITVLYEKI